MLEQEMLERPILEFESEYDERVRRWQELGDRLGFKQKKKTTHKGTRFDVIWWDDYNGKLNDERLWIPVVAIEVETAPTNKNFKGDILGFNTLKPLIGIIHMVKTNRYKAQKIKFDGFVEKVQYYIDSEAQERVVIFTDEDLRRIEKPILRPKKPRKPQRTQHKETKEVYCKYCGTENIKEANYCKKCGKKIRKK